MNTEHCDVLIIGGGPGGISAASKVALQGKKAIVINDGPLMGYGIEVGDDRLISLLGPLIAIGRSGACLSAGPS